MLKEISVEIIRKCPNNCLHCSSQSTINCNEKITYQKLVELVDDAKRLGLKTVCFSGGEPFLHPNLCEMVEYVHSLGLNSYIYSSGIYSDAKGKRSSIPPTILNRIAGKVTKIIINLEAAEPEVYDQIMGTKGCFKYLVETVKSAVEVGITLEAHFVPMRMNINQIEKVIEFCINSKITKISFLRFVAHGRGKTNKEKLLLSADERDRLEERLRELKDRYGQLIRIGTPLLGETEEAHCEAANGKLNIRYDGNVFPCEVFKNLDNNALGLTPSNINQESLYKIYNECEYLNRIREMIKCFSCEQNCENCIGQYILNKLNNGGNKQ